MRLKEVEYCAVIGDLKTFEAALWMVTICSAILADTFQHLWQPAA